MQDIYINYTCNSSTLAQTKILKYIFSWTLAQLLDKISCTNSTDFK